MTDAGRRDGGRTKVVILGGGAASMAAAFELTSEPGWCERYEITVYQQGWRLGGKGASGRNREEHLRIEEHGLHVWFGFYHNALDLMRRCYEELGQGAPYVPWTGAFAAYEHLVLLDQLDGSWLPWRLPLPATGLDADPGDAPGLMDVPAEAVRWLRRFWESLPDLHGDGPFDAALAAAEQPEHEDEAYLRVAAELRNVIARLESEEPALTGPVEDVEPGSPIPGRDRRIALTLIDFFAAVLKGVREDRLIGGGGFDLERAIEIDELDFREWLVGHGARPETAANASFLRALYDLAFAYPDGDKSAPGDMAAGMMAQNLLRSLFLHRGSFMLKMNGGMGDVIFAPLYQVLSARGVRFEFFHAVTSLRLSDEQTVEAIEVVPQVAISRGDGPRDEYQPLIPGADGQARWWPSTPLWDQLEPEGRGSEDQTVDFEREANPLGRDSTTLEVGRDFDEIVLGIGLGALPAICTELTAKSDSFREMVERLPRVKTQSFQLWLGRTAAELGWTAGESTIAGAYAEPFDTYADMDHLIGLEDWPDHLRPSHVAYFTSVLSAGDPAGPDPTDTVKTNCIAFLRERVSALWPSFTLDDLVDGGARQGWERLDGQYWRANCLPTEQYVLSCAGTTKYRLPPGDCGFGNLYIAGDWTRTPINAGCVEAAVISGKEAAAALSSTRPAVSERRVTPPDAARDPTYVDFGGLATLPGPLRCDDSILHCFWARADPERLRRLCLRVFSESSDGAIECTPLFGHVMISFSLVRKISSPSHRLMGGASELYAAVWIPVRVTTHQPAAKPGPRAAMFLPYVWVDNSLSIAIGREVYGYPKTLGRMSFPGDGQAEPDDDYALEAWGMKNYNGNEKPKFRPLLRVSAVRPIVASPEEELESLSELATHTANALDVESAVPPGVRPLLPPILSGLSGVPQIFLKQFRSVEDGGLASLSQIVVARGTPSMGSFRAWPLAHHVLSVIDVASHPLREDLGLADGPLGPSYRVKMDFVVDDGKVLFSRSTGR